MKYSDQIAEIAAALVICQGKVTNAKKDSDNPFFKSKYADLSAIMDAGRGALLDAGLALTFNIATTPDTVILTPILFHKSGQFIEFDPYVIPLKEKTAQGQGSAVTYGRRYLFQTIVGIAAEEDDDGNQASGRGQLRAQQKPAENQSQSAEKREPEKQTTSDPREEWQSARINSLFVDFARPMDARGNPAKDWVYTDEEVQEIYKARAGCKTKKEALALFDHWHEDMVIRKKALEANVPEEDPSEENLEAHSHE